MNLTCHEIFSAVYHHCCFHTDDDNHGGDDNCDEEHDDDCDEDHDGDVSDDCDEDEDVCDHDSNDGDGHDDAIDDYGHDEGVDSEGDSDDDGYSILITEPMINVYEDDDHYEILLKLTYHIPYCKRHFSSWWVFRLGLVWWDMWSFLGRYLPIHVWYIFTYIYPKINQKINHPRTVNISVTWIPIGDSNNWHISGVKFHPLGKMNPIWRLRIFKKRTNHHFS